MMDYTNEYLASDDEKIKSHIYEKMSNFTTRMIDASKARISNSKRTYRRTKILSPGATSDTSDDAKELEFRPKK
ncbi:unnamed protein product [Rhizophagus irregularis]|nr:unnamed protein product [Rhizophagus irregularis]